MLSMYVFLLELWHSGLSRSMGLELILILESITIN